MIARASVYRGVRNLWSHPISPKALRHSSRVQSAVGLPGHASSSEDPDHKGRSLSSSFRDKEGSTTATGVNLTLVGAAASACMGSLSFGYSLAAVNGPMEAISASLGILGDVSSQGLIVSSTLAGAALGSLSGSGLADSLGRNKSLQVAAIPMVAGFFVSATANSSFETMVLGRLLVGLAIGLSSALVPTYLSEIAPTHMRGVFGTMNQLFICSGVLAALLVNSLIAPSLWKTVFLIGCGPAALLLAGMLLSPESPRWLLNQGRKEEANAAAKKLWGDNALKELGPSATTISTSTSESPNASSSEATSSDGILSLLGSRAFRIGIILFAFQQFAGINALCYFSTDVFRQAGVQSAALASVAVGATNVIGTLIASALIEKQGRTTLLINSYLGQALAMLLMAAGLGIEAMKPYSGLIAVLGTLFYILSFALGAGPVTATIIPELNPAATRGVATSAAFVSHWVCNVAVGQTFLGAVSAYGLSSVYSAFGLVALAAAYYVKNRVPETKGKGFDEIQKEISA